MLFILGSLGKATTRLVYDLWAYYETKTSAQPQPAVVYTLARETHVSDLKGEEKTKIQHSFLYSDGFGRELQTKIQAEPGLAPARDGAGKLVREDGKVKMTDTDPRWVGTGRKVYNNKGKPVKQYEPFFSNTHRYETEKDLVEWGVTPILFYDPLERVVATLHPNHTYEKVVFDPWQQATWDVNDTVVQSDPKTDPDVGHFFQVLPAQEYLPTWHTLRTDTQASLAQWPDLDPQTQKRLPGNAKIRAAEKAAAVKAAKHAGTPTVAHLDTLGRTFLTLADNGRQGKYKTHVKLDIEGNPLAITDARGNAVMEYAYDMSEPDEDEEGEEEDTHRIYLKSMDAGERWTLNNVAGNPIRTWDSRKQQFRYKYDALQRPTHLFVQYEAEKLDEEGKPIEPRETEIKEILAERTVYGEGVGNAVKYNLRGEVYQQYDGAGVVTNFGLDPETNLGVAYDFKGNLLRSQRRLAKDYQKRVDWMPLQNLTDISVIETAAEPLLAKDTPTETFTFRTSTTYDALNRPINTIAPDGSKTQPTYNEANLLAKLDVRLREAEDWTPFVTNIDYNAKGQRELIEYGNGTKTNYTYDPLTFQLTHLFTTRGATFPDDCPEPPPEGWAGCGLQSLHYTYDPVGNITHIRDDAQQRIFFKNKRVDPDADYTYDAVYRLIAATGREHLGQKNGNREPIPIGHDDSLRMNRLHPNDEKAMGRYQQQYVYDEVGNILKTIHKGTDPAHPGWTRTYSYNEPSLLDGSKKNNRLSSTTLDQVVEDYLHDAHGNIECMPHLASHGDPKKPNMRWDFEDQLCQVDLAGGGTAFYVYDAEGQRVRKVIHRQNGTRHKERIYLGEFEIYREYNGNGNGLKLERETLHVMDDEQRIALVETKAFELVEDDSENRIDEPVPVIRYQLGNHLDSASLELDVKGKVISYEEYYPYGSTSYQAGRNQAQVSLKRYRYTGKERDEESGFYYHGARYYACWLGRWISVDPVGLKDGINLYLYTNGNPINYFDPYGTSNRKKRPGFVSRLWKRFGSASRKCGIAFCLCHDNGLL